MNNTDLNQEVKRLVDKNRFDKGIISVVDILMQLGYLTKKDYDAWLKGRVGYLEKVCNVNLSKLTLINKSIRKYSSELGLKSSWTGYNQIGTKRRLRFSKSGKKDIEAQYATHYVDTVRLNELKEKSASYTNRTSN